MRAKHFRLISLPERTYDCFAWDQPTDPIGAPPGMPRVLPSRLHSLAEFVLRAANLAPIVEDTGEPAWDDPAAGPLSLIGPPCSGEGQKVAPGIEFREGRR
jgi:hypothetical protein